MSARDWPTERDPVFHCELWTGKLLSDYPFLGNEGAHRIAYERVHGPIPPELVIDHLCRRRRCVNVDHLEAVTKAENERRKQMRYRLKRARCRRGHLLNEVTRLVTPEMGVLCRACAQEALR